MLEDKLNLLLTELRSESRGQQDNYAIVKSWFSEHQENLVENITDMAFVCELPNPERFLLTYPVMGNWFLEKIKFLDPETETQKQTHQLLRELIVENRFNNSHMKDFYTQHQEYNAKLDQLNGLLLSNTEESKPLCQLMFDLYVRVMNITKTLPRKETYTTDLGHGLDGPAGSFEYITWHTRALMESNKAEPLDATIMIVDDQMPEAWYQRMIYVGFKDIPKQQGFFYDCESALVALEHGKYDIILTDLELGEGRMGGVEFIEKAYALQKSQGMQPRISAFSYNKEKLEEAEERLGWISGGESKIMGQVSNNDKGGFKAINFRMDVRNSLR